MKLRVRIAALVLVGHAGGVSLLLTPRAEAGQRVASARKEMTDPPASPTELEAAIRALTGTSDEQLSTLLAELSELEDAQERQRLQRLLEDHLQEVAQAPSGVWQPSPEKQIGDTRTPWPLAAQGPASDELSMYIEMLNLGADATVGELRARDQIVAAIAGVRDPLKRDGLLRRLEEREREAQVTDSSSLIPTQQ